MSSSDYEDEVPRSRSRALFIPFVLLAVAVLFSLLAQIAAVHFQGAGYKSTKAQLTDAIQKRAPQVNQAKEMKNRLEALATDLLELAKTDPRAEAIVKKYDIQRNLNANGTATDAKK